MVAEAISIDHGANAVHYAVDQDRADLIKANHLPEGISAEAMWQRMDLHLAKVAGDNPKRRPIKNTVIRMEISPTNEETAGWTMADWERLTNEFIQAFDSIDLSDSTQRASSKATNLANSQYVAALHRDSISGILHLHIDASRVDMEGNVNDDHLVGRRAVMAAQIINLRRGWENPEDIEQAHIQEISDACIQILTNMNSFTWEEYERRLEQHGYKPYLHRDTKNKVTGYAIMRGNSKYKSSKLGKGRNLMPSTILKTWAKLHAENDAKVAASKVEDRTWTAPARTAKVNQSPPVPVLKPIILKPAPIINHYTISTDEYHDYDVDIPASADDIIANECSVPDGNEYATLEKVQATAMLLFAGYLDGALSMSMSCGGGGNDMSGWGKDKDEDDLKWAYRCARMAHQMCKRRSRGMHR